MKNGKVFEITGVVDGIERSLWLGGGYGQCGKVAVAGRIDLERYRKILSIFQNQSVNISQNYLRMLPYFERAIPQQFGNISHT
jgi:hypothetical protein